MLLRRNNTNLNASNLSKKKYFAVPFCEPFNIYLLPDVIIFFSSS